MPGTLPPTSSRGALVCVIALAAAALPWAAWALSARVEEVGVNDGYVWARAQLEDVLTTRIRSGVTRGMPATLTLRVELWRRRTIWFDKLESTWETQQRVRYDVWSESYRLERRGAAPLIVSNLDSLEAALEQPLRLRLWPASALRPGPRYYVSLLAQIEPLTVDDVREIEGWLSGEVEDKRHAGLGGVTRLPSAVFDAVRNAVGLGDVSVRAQSPDFVLAETEAPSGEP